MITAKATILNVPVPVPGTRALDAITRGREWNGKRVGSVTSDLAERPRSGTQFKTGESRA